ncbi:hypothetical protein [Acinetobacter baumannii]|uniref:ORC-CDC6 family AAA ATPase n=3 Tax=Acinetobacter baumannii TaxID=470 RepID=UPI00054BAAA6|nr:hypothetical protein [Acinetobacter baumannii]MCG6601187.1 hypothetical protein [Acinetobacter baumannii]QBY15628.1 hypothetical protein E4664_17330 [Acinetobacter baumannii]
MNPINPFGSIRAAEYSDEQINSLWVDFENDLTSSILDLSGATPKYLFGGKGSGKTHILRYYSYLVARQREQNKTGIEVLQQLGALTVFYRCNHFGASKFSPLPEEQKQLVFQSYIEFTLFEAIIECLIDIKNTTHDQEFNNNKFLSEIRRNINHNSLSNVDTLESLKEWIFEKRNSIDRALNTFVFTRKIELFESILLINNLFNFIKPALNQWLPSLNKFPLIFFIDEFENLEVEYQKVFNGFMRLANSDFSFRIATRPKGVRTTNITGLIENNLKGHEYLEVHLDDILLKNNKSNFINAFIINRLYNTSSSELRLNANQLFNSLDTTGLLQNAIFSLNLPTERIINVTKENFLKSFPTNYKEYAEQTYSILCDGIEEVILKKLNILRFCKERKNSTNFLDVANKIREDSFLYKDKSKRQTNKYSTSFNHYKLDLFSQICIDARYKNGIPFCGFETIVNISSGNPRNVLNILNKMHEILAFEGKSFFSQEYIDIETQTKAIKNAAIYFAEEDSNYGSLSDKAKIAMKRFAAYLATARFALNIPESSPLAASFLLQDLTPRAKEVYDLAVEFSLIQEMTSLRSDRNSKQFHKLIKLNSMLSPLWNLPTGYRGDLTLNSEVLNAIFDPENQTFDEHLNRVKRKWNTIHIDTERLKLDEDMLKTPEQRELPF